MTDTVQQRRADPWTSVRHAFCLLAEKLLRWCVHPRLRARLLSLLGATIGRNVRIYEVQIFNLEQGFGNLHVADDVHIGPRCLLDLLAPLQIGTRSTLSPGVTILTHADPGTSHASRLASHYPARKAAVSIGSDCWLGANATVLAGVRLGDRSVIAAGAVVIDDVPEGEVHAGVPARLVKRLSEAPQQA